MVRTTIFALMILLSQTVFAQDCQVLNKNGVAAATVKTNGAIGVFTQSGQTVFAGLTHQDVISGRSAEVFTSPQIWTRGNTSHCVMPSAGWSEVDGTIYSFNGNFVGHVTDDGKILNSANEIVGTYSETCANLPQSLKLRLVAGASLATILANQNAAKSSYFIGYNPETCSYAHHPNGVVRAKVLIEPIGCQNCGYTYRVINP